MKHNRDLETDSSIYGNSVYDILLNKLFGGN